MPDGFLGRFKSGKKVNKTLREAVADWKMSSQWPLLLLFSWLKVLSEGRIWTMYYSLAGATLQRTNR